jgi:hypothetical protein
MGFVGMVHEFGVVSGWHSRGRLIRLICRRPAKYTGLRQFGTSRLTPYLEGHFRVLREVGIEYHPLWPCCEGDPLCAVFRNSIGHLVDIQIW